MKVFIAVVLTAAVAVGGYFAYRQFSKPRQTEAQVIEQAPESVSPTPSVIEKAAIGENKPSKTTNVVKTVRANRTAVPSVPKPTGEWKTKLNAILTSNANAQQKVQDLREMLSKLEEAEAEQAVQELTTIVKDEGYAFLKPLAVDPSLPEAVRDEFMVDMMNRPNSIKVPLFLEIARNPDHPDNESAYDSLEIFTGLKYGADWNAWEKGIETWLKENPDRVRQPQAPPQLN
jgi:hypothetical protein